MCSIQHPNPETRFQVGQQNHRYYNTRGFLGFSCDSACQKEKSKLSVLEVQLKEAKLEQFKALSAAKSQVGVWSVYAVQEARDLFWYFHSTVRNPS